MAMNSREFVESVYALLKRNSMSVTHSPSELIQLWRAFVENCKNGYSWGLYEYYNDLSIRFRIELIVKTKELANIKEYEEFSLHVEEIDSQFRDLMHPDNKLCGSTWWEQGVLKYAGSEYRADIKREYGIEIETRDPD